jgi:hypothetical protein
MGDHEVFEEASFAVPMVYFHDWPDVTIHTNKDQPENLDATKLGRVAYLGAGVAWTLAALPDAEAPKLLATVRAAAAERGARAQLAAELLDDRFDAMLMRREAAAVSAETLRSLASGWPSVAAAAQRDRRRSSGRRRCGAARAPRRSRRTRARPLTSTARPPRGNARGRLRRPSQRPGRRSRWRGAGKATC